MKHPYIVYNHRYYVHINSLVCEWQRLRKRKERGGGCVLKATCIIAPQRTVLKKEEIGPDYSM